MATRLAVSGLIKMLRLLWRERCIHQEKKKKKEITKRSKKYWGAWQLCNGLTLVWLQSQSLISQSKLPKASLLLLTPSRLLLQLLQLHNDIRLLREMSHNMPPQLLCFFCKICKRNTGNVTFAQVFTALMLSLFTHSFYTFYVLFLKTDFYFKIHPARNFMEN